MYHTILAFLNKTAAVLGRLNQTELFRVTGFYAKALPAISNCSYAVVLNTNLGRDNARQLAALNYTVGAIAARHAHSPDIPSIYVLGHHPQVGTSHNFFCLHNLSRLRV